MVVLRLLDIQAPLGVAEELRTKEVRELRMIPGGQGERSSSLAWLQLAGGSEEPSTGDLNCGSIGEGLLHAPHDGSR